jgi:hypothetical protein
MTINPDGNGGDVDASLDYDYRNYDKAGRPRPVTPVQLGGTPADLFRKLGRLYALFSCNPLSTLCASYEECPSLGERFQVMTTIVGFLLAGIEPWDVAWHAVAHWKREDESDVLSADDHLAIIPCVLSRGTRFQVFFDKADVADLAILQEMLNYKYGFSSPRQPEKFRVAMPAPAKSDTPDVKRFKGKVGERLKAAISEGRVVDRDTVIAWLERYPKITSVKPNDSSVTVQREGDAYPINLRAFAFQRHFRPSDIDYQSERNFRASQEYYETQYSMSYEKRASRQRQRAYGIKDVNRVVFTPLSLCDIWLVRKKRRKRAAKTDLTRRPFEVNTDPWLRLPLVLSAEPRKLNTRAPGDRPSVSKVLDALFKFAQYESLTDDERSWFSVDGGAWRYAGLAIETLALANSEDRDELERTLDDLSRQFDELTQRDKALHHGLSRG